jgi:hypothetical protein
MANNQHIGFRSTELHKRLEAMVGAIGAIHPNANIGITDLAKFGVGDMLDRVEKMPPSDVVRAIREWQDHPRPAGLAVRPQPEAQSQVSHSTRTRKRYASGG